MHNEQIYTPLNVVNFILDEVGFNSQNNIENKHIIDNSCGNGNFLVEIVRRIFDNVERVDKTYLETYVHGIEIDSNASDESRERLNQLASRHGVTDVEWDVREGNSLELNDFDCKMDYVVGNPPYCNVHHLSEDNYKLLKNQYSFCNKGMTDLYIAFYEKGIKMLNNTGILGYITPNSWLSSKAGENLRQFLYSQNLLSALYNFDIDKLFDNATTFTCVTVLDKKRTANDKIKVYHGNFDKANEYRLVNKEDLYVNGSIYTCNDNACIKNILDYKVKDKNKQFVVKNGLCTLNDKLFIIEKSIGDTNNVLQCVKASKGESKYIIYPYDKVGVSVRYGELPSQIRDLLEEKAKRLNIDTSESNWWLYGRTQAIKDTNKYRISCNCIIRNGNDIILRPLPPLTAVYGGYYIMRNGMIQSEHEMAHLFCQVEGALKSNLFTDFIKSIGKSKNGGYYTFSTKDIENFLNYFYRR